MKQSAVHEIFKILPMKGEDIDEVIEIDSSYSTAPWSRELFITELLNNFSYNFVLKYNFEVVGYINFWVITDIIELNNFVIKKDYRSKGLGKYLMEFLIKTGYFFNVNKIFLEVKRDNFQARGFYKKAGFVEIGVRKNYYNDGEDAILMEKIL